MMEPELRSGDRILLKGMPKGKRVWWKPWRRPDPNGIYVVARTGGHHVTVTIERDVTMFKWRCEEPAEAPCHLYCECEENAPFPDVDGKCERCLAPVKQLDYCNLVTWFEEGGTGEEQYQGDSLVLLDAEIEAVWEGDYLAYQRGVSDERERIRKAVEALARYAMPEDWLVGVDRGIVLAVIDNEEGRVTFGSPPYSGDLSDTGEGR